MKDQDAQEHHDDDIDLSVPVSIHRNQLQSKSIVQDETCTLRLSIYLFSFAPQYSSNIDRFQLLT
ncbi:hypothetical protein [Rossellomorea vietnamensis]|uniref:hypothetical protein n=1 Tax=Rossellomorea vietnamensis TaxID=218284 RepID=UPI0012E725CF|nr:hypothetical protein [Rossellomorea vietnamensis]